MKNKHILKATVCQAEATSRVIEVAERIGIVLPSTHTALFASVYSPIEEANNNGIRLATDAVDRALPGLIGSQCNLEHLGKGFITGIILDAWINDNNEIATIFTFAKNIYEDEYIDALEALAVGTLSVSFELLAETTSQEFMADGTIKLHDIDFQGVGLLIENTPAYPDAKIFEMAKTYKDRVSKCDNKQLICAKQILAKCDNILGQDDVFEIDINDISFKGITTRRKAHFHVVKLDFDGNGETIGTFGDDEEAHTHKIMEYQVQASKQHVHAVQVETLANLKKNTQTENITKADQEDETLITKGGNNQMTEEQIQKIADLRATYGDLAKDVSDEDLLKEEKVAELKQAKEDSEKEAKEKKSELEKAEEKISTLEAENAELKATIEAKDSEIEEVRANAEKIGKLKVELADNPHVKDFEDKDYLDESKIEKAKVTKENDDLKAENKALKEAKEDKTEDKTENKTEAKEKVEASKKDEDLNTGSDVVDEKPVSNLINKLNR